MKHILAYNVKVCKNFFCLSFINSKTNKQYECYALDDEKFNAGTLIKIINSCLLVGYGNNNFDNLILNYIYHQKDVNIHEIYGLSKVITTQQESGNELWRNKDLEFYMYKDVESFDLIETSSIDNIIKFEDRDIKAIELDTLLLNNMKDAQMNLNALNALKIRFKHGFISTFRNRPTKETIRENYIKKLLQI